MDEKVVICSWCGNTYEYIGYRVRCGVKHKPGECCHYGQRLIETKDENKE